MSNVSTNSSKRSGPPLSALLLVPVILGALIAICALISLGIVSLLGGGNGDAAVLTFLLGSVSFLAWIAAGNDTARS